MATVEQIQLLKEFARRRVNLFFSIIIFVAFLGVLMEEVADVGDIIDDGGLVVLAVVSIAIIGIRWRKKTPAELRSVNNVIVVVALAMVGLTFFGIYNEIGDPTAFGDDIAQLIVTVTFLSNRFIP